MFPSKKSFLSLVAKSKRARDVLWTIRTTADRLWWAAEAADSTARAREAEAKRAAAAKVQEGLETFRGLFEVAEAERLSSLFVAGPRTSGDTGAN
jgi:hypothetical protein